MTLVKSKCHRLIVKAFAGGVGLGSALCLTPLYIHQATSNVSRVGLGLGLQIGQIPQTMELEDNIFKIMGINSVKSSRHELNPNPD